MDRNAWKVTLSAELECRGFPVFFRFCGWGRACSFFSEEGFQVPEEASKRSRGCSYSLAIQPSPVG